MELRKEIEIEYYDKKAKEWLRQNKDQRRIADFEGFEPEKLESFRFLYKILKENCRDKISYVESVNAQWLDGRG